MIYITGKFNSIKTKWRVQIFKRTELYFIIKEVDNLLKICYFKWFISLFNQANYKQNEQKLHSNIKKDILQMQNSESLGKKLK